MATRRPLTTVTGREGGGMMDKQLDKCDNQGDGFMNEATTVVDNGDKDKGKQFVEEVTEEGKSEKQETCEYNKLIATWESEGVHPIQQKDRQKGIPQQQRRCDQVRGLRKLIKRTRHDVREVKRELCKRRLWYNKAVIWAHLEHIRTVKGNIQAMRISDRRCWKGGGKPSAGKEESMYQQYIAKLSELPETAQPGAEEYRPLQKNEFERLSIKRRLMELRKIGMDADCTDTVRRMFVRRDDNNYPDTHTKLEIPVINIRHVAMTELIHHKYQLANKIQRLYKLVNGLRREGRMAMRRQQGEVGSRHGLSAQWPYHVQLSGYFPIG